MVTDEALEFLLQNVVFPHLPERGAGFRSFFTVVFWDGKKLYEIHHKEVFIIAAQSDHKAPVRRLRLSVYEDSFVMDEYELFVPGIYALLGVFRLCFLQAKNPKSLRKLTGNEKKMNALVGNALKSTNLFYLNRRVKLETCLQVFAREGAILGTQIISSKSKNEIQRVFQDANAKDFIMITPNAEWPIKPLSEVSLTDQNVNRECSFCQSQIEAWRGQGASNELDIEDQPQVEPPLITDSARCQVPGRRQADPLLRTRLQVLPQAGPGGLGGK